MVALLIALNIVAALFLIAVVLLQSGKGADMGAAFGGASSTVFGASGAGNLLTKLTAGSAAVFMLTSLALAVTGTRQHSVFDSMSEPAVSAPAVPAAPAASDSATGDSDNAPAAAPVDMKDLGPAGQAAQPNAGLAQESQPRDIPGGAKANPPAPGEGVPAPGEGTLPRDNPAATAPTNSAGGVAVNPTGNAAKATTGKAATGAAAATPQAPAPATKAPAGSAATKAPAGSAAH